MKILVTGATGGIGRSLVPLLAARGADVIATGRNAALGRVLEQRGVRFLPADLTRDNLAGLVREAGVIVHLAARSSPWGPPALFEADNVLATRRLIEAAVASGVKRFVHASTPAIFAERRHRLGLCADSPPAATAINDYARTKLAAELIVRGERRIETLILRPSAVLGPDDHTILPRLMRVIRRGFLPLGNDGTALFHPTDARDAAEAFAVAALGSATGVANIAGREPVPIIEMSRALADRIERRVRFPILPEPMLNAMAGGAEWIGARTGREPPITRYSAAILAWSRTFDLGETEELLGWRPAYGPGDILAHAVPA